MAMSVTYTTFNGQIVYENRGGVESYYAPDTLGSTAALLNASGVVTDTFTYQPYGEIASHVGSSVTPFTYCGTLGYYTDTANSSIYVRARYYRPNLARWQTVDPLWPAQPSYLYCSANPVEFSDASGFSALGLLPILAGGGGCKVWKCYANHLLGHGCIEVEGPGGGCSGSTDPSSFYGCPGAHDFPGWDCTLVSTDCEYAANVCSCIKANSGGSPLIQYCRSGGCKQFVTNMACCGCHKLAPGKRSGCEAQFCAMAYWTPTPPASGQMNAGCGGRPVE